MPDQLCFFCSRSSSGRCPAHSEWEPAPRWQVAVGVVAVVVGLVFFAWLCASCVGRLG